MNMKIILTLSAIFVATQATSLVYSATPILSSGGSSQYKSEDSFGNYNFGYDEGHFSGGSFRKEAGDAYGNKYGSYGLQDADGRTRIVNYVADANGFRADIKSNEPGFEAKYPASATINKATLLASGVTYTHPAPIAYAAAPIKTIETAPIAYAAAPFKTFAPAPITYAAAPIKTIAPAPLTYAIAPTAIKTFAAPAPLTYAVAPAPFKGYAAPITTGPVLTYASKAYAHSPIHVPTYAASPIYKGTPFYKPAIAL